MEIYTRFRSVVNIHKLFVLLIIVLINQSFYAPILYAQTKVYGDSTIFGAGVATCWVEIDEENIPMRIGLTLSESALFNLSNLFDITRSINLPLVSVDSLFHHIYFSWNPHGHPPNNIYTVPHFDFHFYNIPRAERIQIPGGFHYVPVEPEFMPDRFIFVPEEEYYSVQQMGVHYVDSLASELHGEPFINTLIYGFYDGKMIFVEPMMTRSYLLSLPDDEFPIPHPTAFQKSGYYPSKYHVYYDSLDTSINIVIKDFVFKSGVSSLEDKLDSYPNNFVLFQNYPNPFNPLTTISWQSAIDSWQSLKVYDILGNEVKTLVDGYKQSGFHEVVLDASTLSSGIYIYRLSTGDFTSAKKLTLIK